MIKSNCYKILALLAITLFTGLNSVAQNWDIDLLKQINPQHPDSKYWELTSSSVYWAPAIVATGVFTHGVVKHCNKEKQQSLEIVTSAVISYLISAGLKEIMKRERPEYKYPNEVFVKSPTSRKNYSLPSGHVSSAFSVATTVTLQSKKWQVAVPAYLWAASVGYSRMYLGKHYPTDVLVGAATGIVSAYLNQWLNKKLFRHK